MHVAKVFIFAVFRHNTSSNTCSIGTQKLPIILQLNFFCKYAIEKMSKLRIFCLSQCHARNKRSQFQLN